MENPLDPSTPLNKKDEVGLKAQWVQWFGMKLFEL